MKKNGFSLIELLVTVIIMLILLASALGAFLSYSEKLAIITTVDELKTYFQRAQSEAKSGDLGGCSQLAGYRVQTYSVGSNVELSLQPVCTAGTANAAQTYSFSTGITVSPALDYTFQVLQGGVSLPSSAASQDITVSNSQNSYVFTIYREGRWSEGAWQ